MYKNYTIKQGMPNGYLHKIWLMMRLTTVILIATFMQVSAAGFAQKISMTKSNAPLQSILKELKVQSGYNFVYSDYLLNKAKPVNIKVKGAELEEVLTEIFNQQPLTYTIDSKTVILKLKKEPFEPVRVSNSSRQDSTNYKGTVFDENGKPLPGATVRVKGGSYTTKTTEMGNFIIYGPLKGTLVVSYLGYITKEINVVGADANRVLKIIMASTATGLGEVSIVSTGYQDIPKERATGSFELISKEQLQHSTDPNLLKRLEGITTSLNFNKNSIFNSSSRGIAPSPLSNLTIRGKNTLNVTNNTLDVGNPVTQDALSSISGQPLVVIDGIASAYSIDQVNPNDVESITILKDAASASIWGSRAANGVIVIKTKRGLYQNPVQVSFNSNVSVTEKLDLFYKKYMGTSDYVDAQIFLYNKLYDPNDPNAYLKDPVLIASQTAISPVADIMNQQKRGQITAAEAKARLDGLRNNDIRNDQSKYLLRDAVNQSYSLALSGGSQKTAWRLSGGYDKTLNNTVQSDANRMVLNYGISLKPIKNLEVQGNFTYSQSKTNNLSNYDKVQFGTDINSPYYIYTRLADDQGNALVVPRSYTPQFIDLLSSTYKDKILNYQYKPLDDINYGYYKTKVQNVNISVGATYNIIPSFSANITFNENAGYNEGEDLKSKDSWYMRDLINRYTNAQTFVRNIPLGDQYVPTISRTDNQTLRGLLSFNQTWNKKHNISAIAGLDISNNYAFQRTDGYFGYDENTLNYASNLDFKNSYQMLFADSYTGAGSARIPNPTGVIGVTRVRTVSYFSNAAYTYDQKYTLSASLRRDFSSLYGVGGTKGGTPFYSVGGSWTINNEKFYNLSWLPYLKLRTTFGYNGNVNPATAAIPLLTYTPAERVIDGNGLAYSLANNPTNSLLRPEKTGILNIGLDFGIKNNRLSGSIEYYVKNTKDLITTNAADPSTGFSELITNAGNLRGHGIDLTLNSLNLQTGLFRWNSNFLFSYNRVKVVDVHSSIAPTAGTLTVNGLPVPPAGNDLSGIFAFKWAGLDPATGDPRGYVDGNVVSISNNQQGETAFSNITNAAVSTLHYMGSATPKYFGSFRNTFSYGSFSLSANLQYKLGYWFRRRNSDMVFYYLLTDPANRLQGAEYANRWQKPGDEQFTNVPSFTYPVISPSRDLFYSYSDINVLKADHIRLQEINFSYTIKKNNWFIKNPRVYANVSNLGIIWRANKLGIDPDIYDYPAPRTYSLGLSANF